jgi:hypothetical protein
MDDRSISSRRRSRGFLKLSTVGLRSRPCPSLPGKVHRLEVEGRLPERERIEI